MITVRKSNIPVYLRSGDLYRTLVENNDDPDEEVTFPENVLKENTTVNSVADYDCLLNSSRYWGLKGSVSKEIVVWTA